MSKTCISWDERAEKVIAQGCGTYSKRSDQFVKGVFPTHCINMCQTENTLTTIFLDKKEQKVRTFYDHVSGLGANIYGIQNSFTLPHINEVVLAEMIVDRFPCIDKLRFLKTGSEACQAAVRIARAYQRNKDRPYWSQGIGNGYHGFHNWCISAEKPGTGTVYENYTKVDSYEEIIQTIYLREKNLGYIIIEPVMLDIKVKPLVRKIRELCSKYGIVLIFDEVITGFRTPKRCIANYWDIQPDIICLGKALGNGYPLSVVGGKRKFMDTPDYFVSSTFAGEERSIASGLQVIKSICTEENLKKLWNTGRWYQRKFNEIWPEGLSMIGIPSRATWKGDEVIMAKYWQEMLYKGHLFGKAWFLRINEKKEVLERVLTDSKEVLMRIKAGKVKLKGQLPKPVFKRF